MTPRAATFTGSAGRVGRARRLPRRALARSPTHPPHPSGSVSHETKGGFECADQHKASCRCHAAGPTASPPIPAAASRSDSGIRNPPQPASPSPSGQKDATEMATSVAVHPSTGAVYVTGEYYLTSIANWQVTRTAAGARTGLCGPLPLLFGFASGASEFLSEPFSARPDPSRGLSFLHRIRSFRCSKAVVLTCNGRVDTSPVIFGACA